MRLLDNEKEIEICEANFHELITKQYDMSTLHTQLDEAMFYYSQYALKDDNLCGCEMDRRAPICTKNVQRFIYFRKRM